MPRTEVLKDTIWVERLAVVVAIGVVGWTWLAEAWPAEAWPAEPSSASGQVPAGVVVEEVGQGSVLEKAGLRPGDVVLAWERLPLPPANPEGAQGTIESFSDWIWLQSEQAPRGTVKLTSQRDGESKIFEVAPGLWDATVRVRLLEGMLEDYAKGKELMEGDEVEAGIDVWRKVVAIAEYQDAAGRLRCWLLFQMGDAWGEARQWEKAHEAYRSALETAQDPVSRVVVWKAIGLAYEKASEFEAAREAFGSSQEIRERTWGESLTLAKGFHDLGRLDFMQSRLDSAQAYWQRALEMTQKLAPDSLNVAASLSYLGIVAWRRGNLARAIEYFEGALEIHQKLASNSLDAASCLDNLGMAALDRGELARAIEYNEGALEIYQKLAPNSLYVASALGDLGLVAWRRGDLDRAAEYFEKGLRIHKKLGPGSLKMSKSLNNLGNVAYDRGELARAAEYFEESLKIKQKLAPDGLDVAVSLNNLGKVALDRGDLDRAVEYLEEALEIHQKLAPERLDVAISLSNLGIVAGIRGDLVRAAEYYKGALEIQQELAPGSSAEAETLHRLATVRRQQSQPQPALALFRQALKALENQVSRLGGSRDVQAGFRAQRTDYYRGTLDLELELHQEKEAFHTLERSRAQSFLAQLAERDLVFEGVPEELEQQRRRIAYSYDQTQDQIARLHPKEQSVEIEGLLGQLRRLRRERDDLTEKIIKASPKLGSLRYPQPLDLTAAQRALDPGTVLLSYSVGKSETHLFVLSREEALRTLTLPIGEEELREDVKAILKLQRKSTSPYKEPLRQVGERLYHALIQPAEASIAKSERMLIVPDGPLLLLPFALLVRDSEYLVEWKPLHSVLSVTVYAELKKERRSPDDSSSFVLAAFGDPQYPTRGFGDDLAADRSVDVYVRSAADRGFDFAPLPYTRDEVSRIAALYPEGAVSTYLGAKASEEHAKAVGRTALSRAPRILHFATHGRYDDKIAMNSFLALTMPEEFKEGRDNGLLQTWEIFEEVRLDADLVVLSACESGVGDELDGEGLIGLTRAFQFAGARTVAATLWQVDDRATAELMTRFYRHLGSGMAKDEALRAAQLEFIRGPVEMTNPQGRLVTRNLSLPYYWAAFQIIGDWQ